MRRLPCTSTGLVMSLTPEAMTPNYLHVFIVNLRRSFALPKIAATNSSLEVAILRVPERCLTFGVLVETANHPILAALISYKSILRSSDIERTAVVANLWVNSASE
jgi:hypothetical protein